MAEFERTMYEFWREVNPVPYVYDKDYADKQQTTVAMASLRIGWLLAHLPKLENVRLFQCVDIGGGTGIFAQMADHVFRSCVSYDVVPETTQISEETLHETEWDIAFCYDSLEHFSDINDLFSISARYYCISYPETPAVQYPEELINWRHYKPGEHLWCLNKTGMCEWLEDKNYRVIACSHVEDAIRTPWCENKPNITTILAQRVG